MKYYLILLLLPACYVEHEGMDRIGIPLNEVPYSREDLSLAVHPNTAILELDRNPIRKANLEGDSKWDIYAWVMQSQRERAMVDFYLWATALALAPIGENQYYTALALENIQSANLAPPTDDEFLQLTIASAYQNVLNEFPNDNTYSAQGDPVHLATLAFKRLTLIGASIPSGWVLLQTENGERAVQLHGKDTP